MISHILAKLNVQASPATQAWMRANAGEIRSQVGRILAGQPQALHQALLIQLHGYLRRHVGMSVWEPEMLALVRDLPQSALERVMQRSQDLAAAREDEIAARVSGEFAVAGALRGVLVRARRGRT